MSSMANMTQRVVLSVRSSHRGSSCRLIGHENIKGYIKGQSERQVGVAAKTEHTQMLEGDD